MDLPRTTTPQTSFRSVTESPTRMSLPVGRSTWRAILAFGVGYASDVELASVTKVACARQIAVDNFCTRLRAMRCQRKSQACCGET